MIIEVEKSVIVIVSLWSDDMDIRPIEFLETATLEVLMKETVHFDQLRHWQKADVNKRLLIDLFYPNH